MDPVRYRVDADDRFGAFNEGWTTFARENAGDALLPEALTGRPLWDFISDRTTAHIYKTMLDRLRAGGSPVQFQFRCDAPDRRRLLSMTISSRAGGDVEFYVTAVHEEARSPVALLDARTPRGGSLLTMCAWCKRVQLVSGAWADVESALVELQLFDASVLPGLTHGICAACQDAMSCV